MTNEEIIELIKVAWSSKLFFSEKCEHLKTRIFVKKSDAERMTIVLFITVLHASGEKNYAGKVSGDVDISICKANVWEMLLPKSKEEWQIFYSIPIKKTHEYLRSRGFFVELDDEPSLNPIFAGAGRFSDWVTLYQY